jgi:hypothetical protein
MQRFPAMRILLQYGKWIKIAIALSIPGLAFWATLQFGIPGWGLVIAAVFVAVVVWFVLSVFVELVRVIAEMLMPS